MNFWMLQAEAIRKILGQDSSRKKREDKFRKKREEVAKVYKEEPTSQYPNCSAMACFPISQFYFDTGESC